MRRAQGPSIARRSTSRRRAGWPSGCCAASPRRWATRGTREDAWQSGRRSPAGRKPIPSGANSMCDGRPPRPPCSSDSSGRSRRATCRRNPGPPISPDTWPRSPRGCRSRRPAARAPTICDRSPKWPCAPGRSRAQGPAVIGAVRMTPHGRALRRVPDLDRPVVTGGRHRFAIGRERDRADVRHRARRSYSDDSRSPRPRPAAGPVRSRPPGACRRA